MVTPVLQAQRNRLVVVLVLKAQRAGWWLARRWLARRAGTAGVVEGLQVGPKGAESLVQGAPGQRVVRCLHLLVQLRWSIKQELLSVEGQE